MRQAKSDPNQDWSYLCRLIRVWKSRLYLTQPQNRFPDAPYFAFLIMRYSDITAAISMLLFPTLALMLAKGGKFPVHGHCADGRLSEIHLLPRSCGVVGSAESFEVDIWSACVHLSA